MMAREQPLAGAAPLPVDTGPSLAASRAWLSRQLGQQVVPRGVLILVCALFILPFYWMVATALKTREDLMAYPPVLWPSEFVWSNFRDAVEYIPFFQYLTNTSIITALTIIGSVISNPIIAYGFSRIDWPGRDKVFYVVLATVFIPYPVLIVALFDIFAKLPRPMLVDGSLTLGGNWINTYLPLVVPMFFGNAFWIFLMRQFLMQIPQDVSDAARIDGASEFRIFAQVVMPLCRPALAALGIFTFTYQWDDFFWPLVIVSSEELRTLPLGLALFVVRNRTVWDLLMAGSVIATLPVLVVFLLFQRHFIRGIAVTGMK